MSPRTRILSLNLGSQNIELAEFGTERNGRLVLQSYRAREVLVDPMIEGLRDEHIAAALREMLDELQVKGGNVNYAIAEQLTVSENTVRTHVSNILAKLELHDRMQAALLALQHHLVSLSDIQPFSASE